VAVACSEVAIALGDAAATYLSVGFRLFGFDAGGGRVGGFSWGVGCGVCEGEGRAAGGFGGFASRRGYAAACRWLYGGVLLTVTAAGSLCRGRSVCGFSPRRLWWPSSRRRCGVEIGGWRCLPRRSLPCFSRRWRPGSFLRWAGCAARLPGWLAAWGAEALGAGCVWRRCRLRVVWFGPWFLVCAAAT